MKVSVVIPLYNESRFLEKSIGSMLDQSFRDLEVIAVDDKSTDNSVELLRRFSDPRLRIIEMPVNGGPCVAINAGLDAATGTYVARMDADDISLPERIAKQVAFMDAHPEIGVCGGQLQLFGTEDERWTFPLSPDACAAQLVFGVPVAHPTAMIRRSILEEHQLRYDPGSPINGFDWIFWLQVGRYAHFANLPDTLLLYRRGAQNIGHGRNRAEDFTVLQRAAFTALGVPFTEEELDLTLMGSMIFKIEPTPARVKALRAWYNKLKGLNAEHHFAPAKAFETRLEQQWSKLFHYLPQYGLAPTIAHLRLSPHWTKDQILYALKYRVNALLGRQPHG
jgi:glycosyltransferase involved in cell wall biosynthesis